MLEQRLDHAVRELGEVIRLPVVEESGRQVGVEHLLDVAIGVHAEEVLDRLPELARRPDDSLALLRRSRMEEKEERAGPTVRQRRQAELTEQLVRRLRRELPVELEHLPRRVDRVQRSARREPARAGAGDTRMT